MKLFFVWLLMDAATESKGGFTPEEQAELKKSLDAVQVALETKNKTAIRDELQTQLKTINEAMEKFNKWQGEKDAADQANQKALDEMIIKVKGLNVASTEVKARSFQTALAEELAKPEHQEGIKSIGKGKGSKYKISLEGLIDMKQNNFQSIATIGPDGKVIGNFNDIDTKTVGNLTLASNLTGDSLASYRANPALLPSQKINFRDILPSVQSPTGLYITFVESAGEVTSADWRQTEGSAKNQIDFDMSEAKTVNKFIAAFCRFSKQAMRSLPFLQNTLPRQLLREFYKFENRYFYDVMATGATGSGTSANTVHVKRINDFIGSQRNSNFNASYVLVSHIQWAEIMNELITNGNYFAAGGVTGTANGVINFSGVPVIPASWVPSNDVAMVFDTDFVERVEVEGVAVEFFEQDSDNVQKNLITARIECYEELNRMLASSVIVGDLGDTSTS